MRDHEVGRNANKALRRAFECQPDDHPTAIKLNNADLTQVFALDEMAERREIGESSYDTFLITDEDIKVMVRDAFLRRGLKPPAFSE